ncbi:hypothetical protein ACIPPQ_19430 [Sphingopyxis sp. LARHCG72]
MELTALLRARVSGSGDLESLLRLNSDNDRELTPTGDEPLEEEIAETRRDALLARVSEEISFRERALGPDYPFEVVGDPLRISLKEDVNATSHAAYLFMLMMTGLKDKLLPTSPAIVSRTGRGRTLFHICASIGVAGVLRDGHTYWFGFPRPDKSVFGKALEDLCSKLGFGRAKNPPPPGLPIAAKDDQIDVVGWRAFRDRRNGTLLIICQAATGNDWDTKSVKPHLGAFTDWFDQSPYREAMASLAVPFPVHHEVDDRDGEDYDEAVFNALQRLNHRHGVVLDRLRITESVSPIASDAEAAQRIGGYNGMNVLVDWIDQLKPELAAAA